ncbi:ABC1 kinase family protein [Chloroflexota bacterium]
MAILKVGRAFLLLAVWGLLQYNARGVGPDLHQTPGQPSSSGDALCGGTMPTIFQTFRHLQRYNQIGRILTRYGFGHVLTQLGIGRAITPGLERLRFSSAEILRATPAERVRMVIEELGPTYIKLGQILSTRADIVPADMIKELEKLQDTVPPTEFSLVKEQVERELGAPLQDLFTTFEELPIASASLGQVHLAILPDGEKVAVKVLRPGVDKIIETDLDIVLELAALAEKRTDWGEYYGILSLVQEFADTLRMEQNYEQEGHNIDRYRHIFEGEDHVRIPSVHWPTTTRRVLTMERIQGIKITDLVALDEAGLDRKEIARRNIRILLHAVLEEGFFHADPHAGNFVVQPDDVIGVMDFGIMGQLDHAERLGIVLLFVGLFRGETDRVVEALSDLGIATRAADRRNLTRDLDRLRVRYFGLELEKIRARSFVEDLMAVAFANRLKMPSNLVLVFKTIAMLEGNSLRLDPELNLFSELEPYARDALSELQSPVARVRLLADQTRQAVDAMLALPTQVQRMLEDIEAGEGSLSIRIKGLDEPTRRLTWAANRLVLAILAVAFVIGPALIIPHIQQIWPQWQVGASFLVMGGFVVSLIITLFLVLSVWRSGR